MEQQELEKWLDGCLNYYNKKTKTSNMKTIEERITQLEQAHGRLFVQQNNITKDIADLKLLLTKEIASVLSKLNSISTEELGVLPEKMVDGRKYIGRISEIIGSSTVHWKSRKADYNNWQIKLVGKDFVYLAFINSNIILEPEMLVEFVFENPFNLKHLKLYAD